MQLTDLLAQRLDDKHFGANSVMTLVYSYSHSISNYKQLTASTIFCRKWKGMNW